jgi:hypothetical protein
MIMTSESSTSTMSMSVSFESAPFLLDLVMVISQVLEYRPLAVVWKRCFFFLAVGLLKRLTDLTNFGVQIRQAGQTFDLMHVFLKR